MTIQPGKSYSADRIQQKCYEISRGVLPENERIIQNSNRNKAAKWKKDRIDFAEESPVAIPNSNIGNHTSAYHPSVITPTGENTEEETTKLENSIPRIFSERDMPYRNVSLYLNGSFLWNKAAYLRGKIGKKKSKTRLYNDRKVSIHLSKKLLWKREASFTLKDLCLTETKSLKRYQWRSFNTCVGTSVRINDAVLWTKKAFLNCRDFSRYSKYNRQAFERKTHAEDELATTIGATVSLDGDESQQSNETTDTSSFTFLNSFEASENAARCILDYFPSYAYIDENNKIVFIINKNTTHQQLGQLMNIQKARAAKKLSRLKFYEVNGSPNHQVVRLIQDGELIPLNFANNQIIKESKVDIVKRVFSIMQEEINKECVPEITNGHTLQDCTQYGGRDVSKSDILRKPGNLTFPRFVEPCMERLRRAHAALERFLPPGDCEPFDSVCVAKKYYDYFRPEKVRVILLAESHAYDSDDCINVNRPTISYDHVPALEYDGPRDFVALVYCLAYGEESILEKRDCEKSLQTINALKSKGTPQFWKLFAACAGDERNPSASYGCNLLKSKTNVSERIRNKLNILKRLKDRGIWLLDTSIVAWYISQPTEYNITKTSKMIHKLQKARPPSNMKRETLILSWELYIKHVVKKAATKGNLRLFVPIGKEVKDFIGRERFTEAVIVQGIPTEKQCIVHHGIPAPNSWIPGKNGLDLVLSELASTINRVVDDSQNLSSSASNISSPDTTMDGNT